MYKFGDKEVCDQQVNDAFWQSMKQRLEWCKGAVAEQLSKTGRKKYYRMDYDVDSEVESVYAAFTDEEISIINQAVADINSECQDEDEKCEAFTEIASSSDVDFYRFVPEEDMCKEYAPAIMWVDVDDVKYCCGFTAFRAAVGDVKFQAAPLVVELLDNEYADLLATVLFCKQLSFDDMQFIFPDIYQKVMRCAYVPHKHTAVMMTELNEACEAIYAGTKEDDMPPSLLENSPFSFIIWNQILSDENMKADDPVLFEIFRRSVIC